MDKQPPWTDSWEQGLHPYKFVLVGSQYSDRPGELGDRFALHQLLHGHGAGPQPSQPVLGLQRRRHGDADERVDEYPVVRRRHPHLLQPSLRSTPHRADVSVQLGLLRGRHHRRMHR